MLKFQKHIAFFFLLVFTIPVIYQSMHVLQHQTQKGCHKHCEANHAKHHHKEDDIENSTGFSFVSKTVKNSCLICDYKFTIKQMPVVYKVDVAWNQPTGITKKHKQSQLISTHISFKASRAPPAMFVL